jgi:hypothetical protein
VKTLHQPKGSVMLATHSPEWLRETIAFSLGSLGDRNYYEFTTVLAFDASNLSPAPEKSYKIKRLARGGP